MLFFLYFDFCKMRKPISEFFVEKAKNAKLQNKKISVIKRELVTKFHDTCGNGKVQFLKIVIIAFSFQ